MNTIAVDLDGTLAHYDHWRGEQHIGAPISLTVSRIKQWLEQGHEVVIFTARIGDDRPESVRYIQDWLEQSCGLPRLEVTNIKRRTFQVFYDDRCIQVEPNTGRLVTDLVRHHAESIGRLLATVVKDDYVADQICR